MLNIFFAQNVAFYCYPEFIMLIVLVPNVMLSVVMLSVI
jgi:hypothetical protein